MTKPTIDELEVLTPDELWRLFRVEVLSGSIDTQYLKDLLYVGCPTNVSTGYWGRTALHWAASMGNFELVNIIVQMDVELDARDPYGETALISAVRIGKFEVVDLLLSKGAEVNAGDTLGRTSLHWATDLGYIEIMKFLISKGADIDARDEFGWTPWFHASGNIREAFPELRP